MMYIYSSVNSNEWPEFGLCWILGPGPQIQESYTSVTLASFLRCLNIGHPSWFNILETDEYCWIQILQLFFGPLEILCSVDGDHIGEAYSRTYLTIDM